MPVRFRTRLSDAWRLIAHSLSGRLLLLTLLYVMVSEVAIFVPSIGRFYVDQLSQRIETAEIAILPFTESSSDRLSAGLRRQLLIRAGASAVILKRPDVHDLFLVDEPPQHLDVNVDLRNAGLFGGMYEGLDCLFFGGKRTVHIIARTQIRGAQTIEVVTNEKPIRSALLALAGRILWEALLISLATSLLVFASLYLAVVRPMGRLMRAMIDFRNNPEDPSRIVRASSRRDEIGRAERELAAMQGELYGFLHQKARLAALGAAVAKIQHDLRNILSSAQLASDRLAKIDDPVVQRLAPRLIASLDRAVSLAANTLRFGRADEHPPVRQIVPLAPIVDEAIEANLPGDPQTQTVAIRSDLDRALQIDSDPEQLYRIILNLIRNAAQVLSERPSGTIVITARRTNAETQIEIADDGPGIPEAVRPKLFQPFAVSGRPGGSGLGLAIARDLARAHGGDVTLVSTGNTGTVFRITIPDRRDN
jgi:signal transduction histidine kinase